MLNFRLVAGHEFRRVVLRRGYLLGILAIPVMIVAVVAMAIFVANLSRNDAPIGYIDHADLLDTAVLADQDDENRVEIRPFASESAALAALEAEEIQAFWIIPVDYRDTLQTDLYFLEEPPDNEVWGDFNDFMLLNLLADLDEATRERLLAGADVTVNDISNGREFNEAQVINIFLPIAASILFLVATMSASGYMLRVVADEKENRTMELMITSISPLTLIGGKALGLLAAALLQLGLYSLTAVIGLLIGAYYVPALAQTAVPWGYLGVMALFFFPAYALLAGMMITIGSAVSELQQGQQAAGILNLFFLAPMFVLGFIFRNPASPLMVFMTLFPTTSFLTISLRWGLGSIPWWQLVVSWILLVGTALFTIWVAARTFRAGMLRYGQPLSIRNLVAILRNGN